MDHQILGGVKIFRPSFDAELAVRNQVEHAMRDKHATGKYTDSQIINEILQDYFQLYDAMLKAELPKIASRHLMEFILFQYDQSCQVEKKQLDGQEAARWRELGPSFRRAVKYLAECTAMLMPDEAPTADSLEIESVL
jgi:hypothetical protein